MTTCYLALGSNLNNPLKQMHTAISHIRYIKKTKLLDVSNFYESTPFDESKQNNYINAAVSIKTMLSPEALLHECQLIENKMGKVKLYHWGPRNIDIDIAFFGYLQMQTPKLTIPHPEIIHRDFVLQPLLDIAPHLTMPNDKPLSFYLDTCKKNNIKKLKKLEHVPTSDLNV